MFHARKIRELEKEINALHWTIESYQDSCRITDKELISLKKENKILKDVITTFKIPYGIPTRSLVYLIQNREGDSSEISDWQREEIYLQTMSVEQIMTALSIINHGDTNIKAIIALLRLRQEELERAILAAPMDDASKEFTTRKAECSGLETFIISAIDKANEYAKGGIETNDIGDITRDGGI